MDDFKQSSVIAMKLAASTAKWQDWSVMRGSKGQYSLAGFEYTEWQN
jgi:hypothetical protein